jgi:hypothetical protein
VKERDEPVARRLERVDGDPSSRDEGNPVHDQVLRLQQAGGNEAVAGALARDDAVAQDAKQAPPRKDGPEEQKPKPQTPRTMRIDGIGELPVLSMTSPSKEKTEIQVTISSDSPMVAKLQSLAASGGGIGKVVIDFGYLTWTLYDVYIGSFQMSGGDSPTVSMSLNFATRSIDTPPGDPPGKVD